ncbi:MAG: hypothetical protein GOVbin630_101 [Prokaryotic dsDNA virus sp.]|nr:MAG: hypothetical protein GOVbin630_101 [Prokaryotic dsDNA virus sp.]|tara:strand:- start:2695 stop:3045 length:351 start_codon:yes stop_codon:yes gene_type:complete
MIKTIFCDIDGTILRHHGTQTKQLLCEPEPLEGVVEKFNEWDRKRYNIILVTGRRESLRDITEEQLCTLGLFYDKLIMGIGGGERVLVNDYKENSTIPTASAYCLERNKGLKGLEV